MPEFQVLAPLFFSEIFTDILPYFYPVLLVRNIAVLGF
jgi:hypothetical protein